MAIFQLGTLIKERRKAMGLSQEALAHGICSVTTLSRIENGERLPTQNHLEALMERLGCSGLLLDNAVNENDFRIHELKFEIRQAYINGKQEELKKLLADFAPRISSANKADQQFLALYQILPVLDQYTAEERLQKLEDALKLTCPSYQADQLPGLLSYEEIVLLNGIAISYSNLGDRSRGIAILYALKRYYENHMVNSEESLRTQPMILYNLSKWLDWMADTMNVSRSAILASGLPGRRDDVLFYISSCLTVRGRLSVKINLKTRKKQDLWRSKHITWPVSWRKQSQLNYMRSLFTTILMRIFHCKIRNLAD